MHILHAIDGLPFGGAERMLVDLANSSRNAGERISVCVTRTSTEMASELMLGVRLFVLGRKRRFDYSPLKALAGILATEKVDIIHAHGRSTFSLTATMCALGICKVPILLHDHFGGIETNPKVPLWFRVAAPRFLSAYVGVYEKLGTWAIRAGVPGEKISVLGNSLDLVRLNSARAIDIHQAFGIPTSHRVGLVVAGIRPDKGIHNLLEALQFTRPPPNITILIVGGDADPVYSARCREEATKTHLKEIVKFVGPRRDVPSIIKGAHFALVPSTSESGPLVLIEYLALGLPVVSTCVGDIGQKALRAQIPGIVPPDDPAAFREAFDHLLSINSSDWASRARMGKSWAENSFDIERILPKWLALYRMAISRAK